MAAGCDCEGLECACRVTARGGPLPEVDPAAWDVRRRRAVRRAAAVRAVGDRSVSVLILDVGGVVIPSLFESVDLSGFPAGPLEGDTDWALVQRGETTERDYWAAVAAARPGLDIAGLWRACSQVRGELRGALDLIAGRLRLVAFTNDMEHFFGAGWEDRFPELRAFDAIVEASRLGVHKPHPEAFRAAAAAVGERPERCLFVDDLQANLDGAARAGMRVQLFDVRDPAGAVATLVGALDLTHAGAPAVPRAFRPRSSAPAGTGPPRPTPAVRSARAFRSPR